MVGLLAPLHANRPLWYLIVAALAAILPDLLWGFRYMMEQTPLRQSLLIRTLHRHDHLHAWGHAKASYDVPFRVGLIGQGAALILILLLHT